MGGYHVIKSCFLRRGGTGLSRVKRGVTSHHRHKKVLEYTKGHRATKHALIKRARESMLKSFTYSFAHRRERKGDMRRLWNARVNAAARAGGLTYSQFIHGLKESGVEINRKILADIAVQNPESFSNLITIAKQKIQS
jgi:large subunit ribosomal protein L20